MTGDRISVPESSIAHHPGAETQHASEGWLVDNVVHPFINGTGFIQIYDTVMHKKAEPLGVEPTKPFTLDWGVQALSCAFGAILPYVAVGKLTGMGMRSIGEGIGAQGMAGRFFASETAAQIIGAGLYDFSKQPYQGETRLGNAAGSMTGFAIFGAGNQVMHNLLPTFSSSIGNFALQGAGRFAVGTLGGLTSYETSNRVANLTGVHNELSWDGRLQSMASGGFVNFALPVVQESANKLVDYAIHSRGKGLPVDRDLQKNNLDDSELQKLAQDNRLARVKRVGADEQTKADTKNNSVQLAQGDGPEKLAHELQHLRLVKQYEPQYKKLAGLVQSNPALAEEQFYAMRAKMESTARATENGVLSRQSGAQSPKVVDSPGKIGEIIAADGKTYNQIWHEEFAQFKTDPKYRPPVEYAGTATETARPNADQKSTDAQKFQTDKTAPVLSETLGATVTDTGINFAITAPDATKMELLIYKNAADKTPSQVIALENTNGTWHRFVDQLPEGTLYQYRAYGDYNPAADGSRFNGNKVVLDPYAKAVAGSVLPINGDALAFDNSNQTNPNRNLIRSNSDNAGEMPKAVAVRTDGFNWQGDRLLGTPMQDSIIYEMNLRGFTATDNSIPTKLRGTYQGLVEKIPYLKDLGITAVELMPIMQIDRSAWPGTNPLNGKPLTDQWGYNPLTLMAPDSALAADSAAGHQVNEFKSMVKSLHDNKIEVILDVVYNHSREGNQNGPTVNYKGLANDKYYQLQPGHPDQYADHTGTGNTINTNDPTTMKLALDSMRYWVNDMHVDGFRFDLASIFKIDADGTVRDKTPIINAIEKDTALSKVKLVAEPWSIDQYDEGHFSNQSWAEWRGKFRDTARSFVKGDAGQTGKLADLIAGSPNEFDQSKGRNPVNPITVHDGYTLNDLVSYQDKHNEANGENNRDGNNENKNWNHGVEGPVDKANIPADQKAAIDHLRTQQMKNLKTIQMLSQGTPIELWGDEVRRTADGNNNYWVQQQANNMPWDKVAANQDMFRFSKMINELRQSNQIGRLGADAITWHGTEPNKPDFSDGARFIAWQYRPVDAAHAPIYVASNAYWEPLHVTLPPGKWHQLVNTFMPSGQDIFSSKTAPKVAPELTIQPRSTIVLEGDLQTAH